MGISGISTDKFQDSSIPFLEYEVIRRVPSDAFKLNTESVNYSGLYRPAAQTS